MIRTFAVWFLCLVFTPLTVAGGAPQADAEALLARVKKVIPQGWTAKLLVDPNSKELDWVPQEWRAALPGLDGRRIEIRRQEASEVIETFSGPGGAGASMVRKDSLSLAFALTIGERQNVEESKRRLAELTARTIELQEILKPSFQRLDKDGYFRYSVPRDNQGKHALQEYELLWSIKRAFPQWEERSLSVGFRPLAWVRKVHDERQKQEYRDVKEAVLGVLHPIPGWELIPSDEF